MEISDSDKVFSGSIPTLYDEYHVPLIFEPYAADMLERLRPRLRAARRVQSNGVVPTRWR